VKKNTLFGSLKGRKLRFGGYSALLILAVLAVVVVINVLVGQVPGKLDMTQNRIYSLSEETYTLLDQMKSDVTIVTVGRAGTEDPTVKEILGRYAARSRHVKLETIDPDRNPGWARQYDPTAQGISPGSLVVIQGKKYKTIGLYDMYNYDTSNPNQQPQLTSLSVEQRVTAALLFVTADRNVTLAVLQGHGEQTLDGLGLSTAVGNENYAVKSLSLISEQAVPADTDILLILAPKNDLPVQDVEKIRAWLDTGGRAVVLVNIITAQAPMTNLETLLQSYGVQVQNVVVVEADPGKVAAQNPLYVIPNQEPHEILASLRKNKYDIIMPGAQNLQVMELKKKSLKIDPLLTSSAKSYGIRDIPNAKSLARTASDPSGPFTLAVAITDAAPDASRKDAKLIVAGNIQFLGQSLTSQVPGNGDFFMNSLGWLRGQKQTLTVRPKSLLQMRLSLTSLQAMLYSALVVILIPVLILGMGFAVWVRRRHL
jgi:ABC-2 type transport system permease protein